MGKKVSAVMVIWLFVVGISLFWNLQDEKREIERLALQTGRTIFDQIVLTRVWNVILKGVYAPITERTQPNSYLDVPLRDVTTTDGQKLTMINPAYMTRQISELATFEKKIQFHLTSLNPLNPSNKAADWEAEWLQSFERGEVEKSEFIRDPKGTIFRYMAPVKVKDGCLKCHAAQGYEVGDIRGGISISIPFIAKKTIWPLLIGHGVVSFLGLVGICVSGFFIGRSRLDLIKTNEQLYEAKNQADGVNEILRKTTNELCERVKELNCLYSISKLIEDVSLEKILQDIADIIPAAWLYPESTCARIILEQREYNTYNFKESTWMQSHDIVVHGKTAGRIDVCYLKEHPQIIEGPFLKEERDFINAIAERLGMMIEHKQAEKALKKAHEELEKKVGERTEALKITNEQLEQELHERRRAEKALRESEERHAEAQSIAQIGHWELNLITNELFWSDEQYNIFEIDKEKFGASYEAFIDTVHPDDRDYVNKAYTDSVKGKSEYDVVHRFLFEGDRIKYVHERCRTEYDEQGNPLRSIGTTQDITSLKTTEEEKKGLKDQLEQAQKMESIGTLAGGIAHDFNNILSAIYGYTDLAREDINDPETLQQDLDEIYKGAERARQLIRQILTFSRKTEPEKRTLQISLVVKEALKLLRSSIPTTIDIKQDITSQALVQIDPTQIHQIVMNLCTNAYHAMRETGGTLGVVLKEVEVPATETIPNLYLTSGRYLQLEVSDTGTGMDKETKSKIFEPYYTTKGLGEGTGLGLAVVYGAVNDHSGTITVDSEPGQGTTFHIYLPVYEGEPDEIPRKELDSPIEGGSETIMFVDDDVTITDIARKALLAHGYMVNLFTNAVQAYQELQQHPNKYDLIITDMTMPYMTGAELAQKAMEIRPSLPVILCSGYSELIDGQKALAMGIKKFCEKPLSTKHILQTARQVLDDAKIYGTRILFVDDVQFNADLGKLVLEKLGCEVTVLTSGHSALDLFSKTPGGFDIIVTDQNMPNMTGLELAKQSLAIRLDIPIILLTGDKDVLDHGQLKNNGISEILGKPLAERALARAICSALK